MRKAIISRVISGSPADKAGLKLGDALLTINGQQLRDILDYQVITDATDLTIEVDRKGKTLILNAHKACEESLGIRFSKSVFDHLKRCCNRCLFCFIDQNPPSLRSSLYLKDDDFRLSFLYGNFITLTNLTESEVERIIAQRLSPLYVSLHSTDPALRRKMLGVKGKDKALFVLERLLKADIDVHLQIVLCPGINDGPKLERTIFDLALDYSRARSVGIVPVGITAYQQNTDLRLFDLPEVRAVIEWVDRQREKFKKQKGTGWLFLADEFYLRTGSSVPELDYYEDFSQLENGIGLTRLFINGVEEELSEKERQKRTKTKAFVLLTGELFAPVLKNVTAGLSRHLKVQLGVAAIPSLFFGGQVSVAGLLTGSDIVHHFSALREQKDSKIYLIPDTMLNQERHFLDDLDTGAVAQSVGCTFEVVPSDGASFVKWLLETGERG